MSGLCTYNRSIMASCDLKSQQSKMTHILDGKCISPATGPLSEQCPKRVGERGMVAKPMVLPPQIVQGVQSCGSCELFVEAVEQNMLQQFLKLTGAKPAH
ncbi:SH3 domain-binding glutamic acid-rich-like protein 3 [Galemys pyrenaicus]|uniref:SH3 domain-binding glutamic acid-rich-like protein 3 n=1 Tax=Galemys pyrenaicus TaxID=202257 RepID=A0A8J6DHG8_GALPY|nr:SH3 domain-binding glutamic acid-rich-like protein 3 [Galemys pyrenaicus]